MFRCLPRWVQTAVKSTKSLRLDSVSLPQQESRPSTSWVGVGGRRRWGGVPATARVTTLNVVGWGRWATPLSEDATTILPKMGSRDHLADHAIQHGASRRKLSIAKQRLVLHRPVNTDRCREEAQAANDCQPRGSLGVSSSARNRGKVEATRQGRREGTRCRSDLIPPHKIKHKLRVGTNSVLNRVRVGTARVNLI